MRKKSEFTTGERAMDFVLSMKYIACVTIIVI